MRASQILGGLTLGQADMIRKGVAKKKFDLMNRWIDLMIYGSEEYKRRHAQLVNQYPLDAEGKSTVPLNEEGKPALWVDYEYEQVPDVEGAIARGFDEPTLLKIKADWIKFGNYCFNKAHSAAYAFLSCITAWLKCYYPVEFMAALLTMAEGKKDKNGNPKTIHYMKECEEMGIRILSPDINQSMSGWTPISYNEIQYDNQNRPCIGEIRYGLASIGGVSEESVVEIILRRSYSSLEDFIAKVNSTKVNKTKVIALIKAGCFDSFTPNRNLLLRNYYRSRGEEYEHIPTTTNKATILSYEREVFGTAISIRSRWEKIEEGAQTQLTGHINEIESWRAKTGKTHFTLVVETQEEPIFVTVWGYLMEKYKNELQIGNKVTIKGEKSKNKLIAKTVQQHANMYEVDLPSA